MSLSGAIYLGMSGMDAFTQGLQTISNNVANLNTNGYKSLTASFSDLFDTEDQNSDGADEQPEGTGVKFNPSQIDFAAGTPQQTSSALDLDISGNGFLMLLDGSDTEYTQTGSFAVDSNGYISLQGSPEKRLAVLNASGQPGAFNVNGLETNPAAATTSVTFENNLSSSAASDTVSDITVFDSTGAQHSWQATFAPNSAGAPGSWTVTVTDETGATVGVGTIDFNGGDIDPANETVTISANYADAQPLSVVLNFAGVTSFATGTTSTLKVDQTDGNGAGTLSGVAVTDGQVQLSYSNGQTLSEGSVAVATFLDPQALQETSGGAFQLKGGASPLVSASGQNGAGAVNSQEIEGSNVDLTQEFGSLILIERGYQASSEVVSIANDMIQDLFGIRGQG